VSTETIERARPAIDPRIAARRNQVVRDQGRRRLRRLLVCLGIIAAVAVAWGLTRTPLLDIDGIDVRGLGQTTEEQVVAASGLSPGDQLLDVDAAAVRERLLALPFVKDASVRVGWPDTVVIGIAERQPVAVVPAADGSSLLVDAEGRILGPAVPGWEWIPIEGLEVGQPGEQLPAESAGALAVLAELTPGLRSRVEAVMVVGDNIDLRVRPAGVVWLGPVTDLEAKLRSLRTVFAQVDDRDLATVDLRVADQAVVTRVPPETVAVSSGSEASGTDESTEGTA
jgi:cell division protein FtsQ